MRSPGSAAQLLVEGTDPCHVFREFCRSWSLSEIEVRDFGGITQLRTYLDGLVRTPEFSNVTRLGIIRDAEESAESAFQSVHDSLQNAGLDAPDNTNEPSSGSPSVSVLILPDGNNPGNLESLIWRSINTGPEAPCIRDFLGCLKKIEGVNITRPDKARVHAYLAGKPQPNVSVGVAARKGYWDPQHPVFSGLRCFLITLNGAAGISGGPSDGPHNEVDSSGAAR